MTPRLSAMLLAAATPLALAQSAPPLVDVYGNLHPELKVPRYGAAPVAGTEAGTMSTLLISRSTLSSDATPRAETDDLEWSNAYIAVRGQLLLRAVTLGHDLQGLVNLRGAATHNFRVRDGYAYVQQPSIGRLAVGKMDTEYMKAGDSVRVFGILSSGNFVSTPRVLSVVGWRASGASSFNNRIGSLGAWTSAEWLPGFNVVLSRTTDAVLTAPGHTCTFSAAALQWRRGPWYTALGTERYRDWLPMSSLVTGVAPAASPVRNGPLTTSSTDSAWYATLAWISGPWRVGADSSRLRCSEDDPVSPPGKLRDYASHTWAISAEYRMSDNLRPAANHVRTDRGRCSPSAGGLGGNQTSLGATLSTVT